MFQINAGFITETSGPKIKHSFVTIILIKLEMKKSKHNKMIHVNNKKKHLSEEIFLQSIN